MDNSEIFEDYQKFIQIVRDFIRTHHLTIIWDKYHRKTDLYNDKRHLSILKSFEKDDNA